MRHRKIQNQQARRQTVVLSARQNNIILDLNVSAFISYCWGDLVNFDAVPNRTQHQTEPVNDPVVCRLCCGLEVEHLGWSRNVQNHVSHSVGGTDHRVIDA